MEILVPYGAGKETVRLAGGNPIRVVEPNEIPVGKIGTLIEDALLNPCGSDSFAEFVSGSDEIVVIVNDETRPTPTEDVLTAVSAYIAPDRMRLIIATGTHRGPDKNGLRQILGRHYDRHWDVVHIHDSRDEKNLSYIGTSKRGTKIFINRLCVEARKILVIGSVEPHYYAGFTGGRKAFLPGTASYDTIEQNHKYALEPEAAILSLEGNPVHEDMVDALSFMDDKEIFAVMTVLDGDHNLCAVAAGDINDSFHAAVEKAKEVFVVPVEAADIVVSIVNYPMDIDLYQSHKAIENGKCALRDSGIFILVSQCRDGVGNDEFVRILASSALPEDVFEVKKQKYRLGSHKAVRIAELLQRAEIWTVTDIPDSVIESIFMRPFHGVQTALDAAIAEKGEDARVLFLMDGSMMVPEVMG
ncbi:MAG: nickel-dependent lactate racemase [Kiritimatiellae bacterium]|nr:nickel-dependent lactate racemase [Kiritimatiellia bacterium]